jgi:hypothetical protein
MCGIPDLCRSGLTLRKAAGSGNKQKAGESRVNSADAAQQGTNSGDCAAKDWFDGAVKTREIGENWRVDARGKPANEAFFPQPRTGVPMRLFVAAVSVVSLIFSASAANAKPRHGVHRYHVKHHVSKHRAQSLRHAQRHGHHKVATSRGPHRSGFGPRPSAWCGYFMRTQTGLKDPALNLARNWARVGSAAHGPAPGVIGVMRHHVVKVISVAGPGKVLALSGNDSHAVRTRVRSIAGVIAWRRV